MSSLRRTAPFIMRYIYHIYDDLYSYLESDGNDGQQPIDHNHCSSMKTSSEQPFFLLLRFIDSITIRLISLYLSLKPMPRITSLKDTTFEVQSKTLLSYSLTS